MHCMRSTVDMQLERISNCAANLNHVVIVCINKISDVVPYPTQWGLTASPSKSLHYKAVFLLTSFSSVLASVTIALAT